MDVSWFILCAREERMKKISFNKKDMIFNTKTTCFTIEEIAFYWPKDSFLQDKTTCFVMHEVNDIQPRNII